MFEKDATIPWAGDVKDLTLSQLVDNALWLCQSVPGELGVSIWKQLYEAMIRIK